MVKVIKMMVILTWQTKVPPSLVLNLSSLKLLSPSRPMVTENLLHSKYSFLHFGKTQPFLWRFYIPKEPGEKIPAFQGCAKIVCFPSWHGSRVSGSVCLSLLVSINTWCSLYDMRGHLGISGSVFRDKSICFGDQMSLGVHLRA